MNEELLDQARRAADAAGVTLSSWLSDAAADRLRLDGLRELVEAWETEHGAITRDELEAFERKVAASRRRLTRRRGRVS